MVLIHPSGSLWARIGHWLEKHLCSWEGQHTCSESGCPYQRHGLCYLWGDGQCSLLAEEEPEEGEGLTETISEDGATVVLSE